MTYFEKLLESDSVWDPFLYASKNCPIDAFENAPSECSANNGKGSKDCVRCWFKELDNDTYGED